jgi:DNA transformation protein
MNRDRIEELFAPLGPVAAKRMFGGYGIYADGLFFAIESEDEIFLKADAETQEAFAAAGSTPFVYRSKDRLVTMSYWRLPDEARDDPEELRKWARLAVDAARHASAGKQKPKTARQKR